MGKGRAAPRPQPPPREQQQWAHAKSLARPGGCRCHGEAVPGGAVAANGRGLTGNTPNARTARGSPADASSSAVLARANCEALGGTRASEGAGQCGARDPACRERGRKSSISPRPRLLSRPQPLTARMQQSPMAATARSASAWRPLPWARGRALRQASDCSRRFAERRALPAASRQAAPSRS